MLLCLFVVMYLYSEKQEEAMPVIAIVNQKGGKGKMILATKLTSESGPELLLHADPQGSAQDSADSQRQSPMNLDVRAVNSARLVDEIKSLAPLYK